ncbi:MAG: ECF transporter S component [Clostridiales bacterium]|nr:ECF transporter S component [Clostridiales bacterium]
MNKNIKKWILASLFTAMVTVGTMVIQVPTPTKGYIHIGDTLVYLSGILLGNVFGFLAAAFGSFLADFFSGYLIYAIPTFMIKGLDALAVGLIYRALSKNVEKLSLKTFYFAISVVAGTIIMVGGYYIFESALYGYKASLLGVVPNIIQGIGGGVLALPVLLALEKTGITYKKIMNSKE